MSDDDDDNSILDDHVSRVWRCYDDEPCDSAPGRCAAPSRLIEADDDAAAALCEAVQRLELRASTDTFSTLAKPPFRYRQCWDQH